jgi:hypothetical protein
VRKRRDSRGVSPRRPLLRDSSPTSQRRLDPSQNRLSPGPRIEKSADVDMKPPPRSRSPTPAKPDPLDHEAVVPETPTTDQYKLGRVTNVSTEVRDRSPSPPRFPRGSQQRPHQRSPPRGPRNHTKPPAPTASPAQPSQGHAPTKQEWANNNTASPNSGSTPVTLPTIPPYKSTRNTTIDAEVRTSLYHNSAKLY